MARERNCGPIISVRLEEDVHRRVEYYQEIEKRGAKSEMVRILIEEALEKRDANGKRKRA